MLWSLKSSLKGVTLSLILQKTQIRWRRYLSSWKQPSLLSRAADTGAGQVHTSHTQPGLPTHTGTQYHIQAAAAANTNPATTSTSTYHVATSVKHKKKRVWMRRRWCRCTPRQLSSVVTCWAAVGQRSRSCIFLARRLLSEETWSQRMTWGMMTASSQHRHRWLSLKKNQNWIGC